MTKDEPARLADLYATDQLDTPIEERFEIITRMARRLLGVPIAAISLVETDRQWFKSISGLNALSTGRDVSFCGHTILDNNVLVVPDSRKDPRFADNPLVIGPPNIVFYAGCPIRSRNGSNIASVCVIDTKPRQMSDEEMATLRDLAALAQQQIELTVRRSVQTDLINQIDVEKRNALIDPLTRLWNRRAIDDLLSRQLAECNSADKGTAVIILDVDHFKGVNDQYGHPVGDEVLREVGRRLLAGARQSDSVGRYGGEEFLVVLGRCAGPDRAAEVAERLRQALLKRPIETDVGDLSITASFGVDYASPELDTTPHQMIRNADVALYQAKADGRNCVRPFLGSHAPAQG